MSNEADWKALASVRVQFEDASRKHSDLRCAMLQSPEVAVEECWESLALELQARGLGCPCECLQFNPIPAQERSDGNDTAWSVRFFGEVAGSQEFQGLAKVAGKNVPKAMLEILPTNYIRQWPWNQDLLWIELLFFASWKNLYGQASCMRPPVPGLGHETFHCVLPVNPLFSSALLIQGILKQPRTREASTLAAPHPAQLAKTYLVEDPSISPTQLAKRVGVARSTLYKKSGPWGEVRKLLKARGSIRDIPRGSKAKDGKTEAWDDDKP